MSIAERNENAMAYIEKCERRRQRKPVAVSRISTALYGRSLRSPLASA